jgi:hypothetical protein
MLVGSNCDPAAYAAGTHVGAKMIKMEHRSMYAGMLSMAALSSVLSTAVEVRGGDLANSG